MAIVPPTFAPNPGQPDATTVNSATAAAAATAWPRPALRPMRLRASLPPPTATAAHAAKRMPDVP